MGVREHKKVGNRWSRQWNQLHCIQPKMGRWVEVRRTRNRNGDLDKFTLVLALSSNYLLMTSRSKSILLTIGKRWPKTSQFTNFTKVLSESEMNSIQQWFLPNGPPSKFIIILYLFISEVCLPLNKTESWAHERSLLCI